MKKLTQKEIVKNIIIRCCKTYGSIKTWDIEDLVKDDMMAGSGTRYARTLCQEGFIRHEGDRHTYVLNV